MAIVQISRITHRKGLMENLPQLAGGEFGWALDEQRLFIGNGTLADGAPIIGNTEILTQHSDILGLAASYTFKGEVENPNNSDFRALSPAQTGVTVNSPVARSLQARLDDIAIVKDFGAVGDGVTDDTDAINRALHELFCVGVNEETRRSLLFPAGVYKVTGTIKIPPFAKLVGEGIESTVILYETEDVTPDEFVVQTADSLQQINANIGENGAVTPQGIEVSSLTIKTTAINSLLKVDRTSQSYFDSVNFEGDLEVADLTSSIHNTSAINIESSANYETQHITFDKCKFSKTTYGFFSKYNSRGITISNCSFNTHYKGVIIGEDNETVNGGPQGVRVVQNLFDLIAAEGIEISESQFNVSGFNIFLEVGNGFNGLENPIASNINFKNSNNMSYGDVFARDDLRDAIVPRVTLNHTSSIAFDGTYQLKFGQFHKTIGFDTIVSDATAVPETIFELSNQDYKGFEVHYSMRRNDDVRTGKLISTAGYGAIPLTYSDEYTESNDIGMVMTVTQAVDGTIECKCLTTPNGHDVLVTYTIDKFVASPALVPPPPPPPAYDPLSVTFDPELVEYYDSPPPGEYATKLITDYLTVSDGLLPYTNYNISIDAASDDPGDPILGEVVVIDGNDLAVGDSIDVADISGITITAFDDFEFESYVTITITVTDSDSNTESDTAVWTFEPAGGLPG